MPSRSCGKGRIHWCFQCIGIRWSGSAPSCGTLRLQSSGSFSTLLIKKSMPVLKAAQMLECARRPAKVVVSPAYGEMLFISQPSYRTSLVNEFPVYEVRVVRVFRATPSIGPVCRQLADVDRGVGRRHLRRPGSRRPRAVSRSPTPKPEPPPPGLLGPPPHLRPMVDEREFPDFTMHVLQWAPREGISRRKS